MDKHYQSKGFPDGFLWGAATSSHQVEGGNKHNDWWAFEQQEGHIADGTTSGRGVDHFNRYKEDFALAESMHHNAHRLSLEWSRFEPKEGVFDAEAFAHYREVLKDLKARKMTVMLTLHHFTNPVWLSKKRGWERRHVVGAFTRFTQKVTEELGEYVDLWVTINEPMVYALQGYVTCEWPPAKKSWFKAARVIWNMSRAHTAAYKVIHAWGKKTGRSVSVGIANNVSSFIAYRKHSLFDAVLLSLLERFANHGFYMLTGARRHDFLGLNYYFHFRLVTGWRFLRQAIGRPVQDLNQVQFEASDIGWELFPHGIFDVCVDLATYKKPIYITENGLATSNDDKRVRVIVGYLLQVHYAIQSGADVRGYFHWSLLDNFEWAKGWEPTFGLVHVDRATMKRTPKTSAEIYGLIARDNEIKHDFLQFLGHGTADILKNWKERHDTL